MINIRIIFALIILFMPLIIYLLAPHKLLLKIILYLLVIYFLVYKIGEYYYHIFIEKSNQYPVEFSAISYFLLAIGVLFRWKGLREFSGLLAILSGFFYGIANIVAPESFLHNARFYLEMARLNHTLLFLAGLIVNTIYYNRGKYFPYLLGIALVLAYAFTMKQILNYQTTDYVIYEVVLATFLKNLNLYYWYILIFYYPLIILLYLLLIKLYFKMNEEFFYVNAF